MTVTASDVRQGFLDHALDAQAHNTRQQLLILNTNTASIDSLGEVFVALAATNPDPRQYALIRKGVELIYDLQHSNLLERASEQRIAGHADTLATDLQRTTHAARHGGVWSAKKIARAVRDPLADLGNPVVVGERRARAELIVGEVVASVPRSRLLSAGVRHELGGAKFAVLAGVADAAAAEVAA